MKDFALKEMLSGIAMLVLMCPFVTYAAIHGLCIWAGWLPFNTFWLPLVCGLIGLFLGFIGLARMWVVAGQFDIHL